MPKNTLGWRKLDYACFPFLPSFSPKLTVGQIYPEAKEQRNLGNVVPRSKQNRLWRAQNRLIILCWFKFIVFISKYFGRPKRWQATCWRYYKSTWSLSWRSRLIKVYIKEITKNVTNCLNYLIWKCTECSERTIQGLRWQWVGWRVTPPPTILSLVNLSFKLCVENVNSGKENIQLDRKKFIEIIRFIYILLVLV